MSCEIPREKLVEAYNAAYKRRDPCDICKKQLSHHHATIFGENLCHDCYLELNPVVQHYPGDRGLPPFFSERGDTN